MAKIKKQPQVMLNDLEPRWFIWTITLLIAVGMSLTGYIMVTAEQDSAQAYDGALIQSRPK